MRLPSHRRAERRCDEVQTTGGHVRPRGILDDLPQAREFFRGDRVELVLDAGCRLGEACPVFVGGLEIDRRAARDRYRVRRL